MRVCEHGFSRVEGADRMVVVDSWAIRFIAMVVFIFASK